MVPAIQARARQIDVGLVDFEAVLRASLVNLGWNDVAYGMSFELVAFALHALDPATTTTSTMAYIADWNQTNETVAMNEVTIRLLSLSNETGTDSFVVCTRALLADVVVGTNDVTLAVDTLLHGYSHFLIFTESSLVEQSTPSTHLIFDAIASVSGIAFADKDMDKGDLGGFVSWRAPTYTDRLIGYHVYLAASGSGFSRSQLGPDPPLAPDVSQLMIPKDTVMGGATHLVIYTRSSLTEQTTPVAFMVKDLDATVVNSTFLDLDLDATELGGKLAWAAPEDVEQVTQYRLYLATHTQSEELCDLLNLATESMDVEKVVSMSGVFLFAALGLSPQQVEQATLDTLSLFYKVLSTRISVVVTRADGFWTVTYTLNAISLQAIDNLIAMANSVTSGSAASFTDILFAKLAIYGWDTSSYVSSFSLTEFSQLRPPGIETAFNDTLSLSDQVEVRAGVDGGRSEVGSTNDVFNETTVAVNTSFSKYCGLVLLATLPLGNESYDFPVNFDMARFTHTLIYTVASMVEQTTPLAHELVDTFASVSEVSFIDRDLDHGELGGLLAWKEPSDRQQVSSYRVYFAVDDVGTERSQVGGALSVGSDAVAVDVDTPILAYVQGLVYTQSSLTEQTTPVGVALVDTSASTSGLEFPDFDLDEADLGGTISWVAPLELAQVTNYFVYFARLAVNGTSSCSGDIDVGVDGMPEVAVDVQEVLVRRLSGAEVNDTVAAVPVDFGYVDLANDFRICYRVLIANVSVGVSNLILPSDTALLNYTHLLVYTSSSLVEQTSPTVHLLHDEVATVASVSFIDGDLDILELGGLVSWTPPPRVARVAGYRVYMSMGDFGSSRSQIGSFVEFGTNSTTIQVETPLSTYSHLAVYTASSLTEQTTPRAFLLVDLHSTASGLSFTDLDLDATDLGGDFVWSAPEEYSQVTHYVVYFARIDGNASVDASPPAQDISDRDFYASFTLGTENLTVPADTRLLEYTHLLVYTTSALVEQTTPAFHHIFDADASVSDIQFQGKDLDLADLGGVVEWQAPADVTRVKAYILYLAESGEGLRRSQVSGVLPLGVSELLIPAETPHLTYTHFTVYTQSALVEQTTPVALGIDNEFSRAFNVSFSDQDLDAGQLGGDIMWHSSDDTSEVLKYFIYLAENAKGSGRSLLGNVTLGIHSIHLPVDTPISNYTHIVVYSMSSLVEQTTPGSLDIVDVISSVSDVGMIDKDLDAMELGGTIVWTEPQSLLNTRGYAVYLATTAAGSSRSQVSVAAEVGTSKVSLAAETPLLDYMSIVVYTKSSLAEQTTPVAFTLVDNSATCSGLDLPDFDLDATDLGGVFSWNEPRDTSQVTHYHVYFAIAFELDVNSSVRCPDHENSSNGSTIGRIGASRAHEVSVQPVDIPLELEVPETLGKVPSESLVLRKTENSVNASELEVVLAQASLLVCSRALYMIVPVGTNKVSVPEDTPLLNYTHLLVYSASSLVEQTTPAYHLLDDKAAVVSAITFTDKDLDAFDLGGSIQWTAPPYQERIEDYNVYMSSSTSGSKRSKIGASIPLGSDESFLAVETPLLSYTHFVVYTRSTLQEQTTPASSAIVDTVSTVTNITFPDFDLDRGELGGELSWTLPEDSSLVTHYVVYLARLGASSVGASPCADGGEVAMKFQVELASLVGSFVFAVKGLEEDEARYVGRWALAHHLGIGIDAIKLVSRQRRRLQADKQEDIMTADVTVEYTLLVPSSVQFVLQSMVQSLMQDSLPFNAALRLGIANTRANSDVHLREILAEVVSFDPLEPEAVASHGASIHGRHLASMSTTSRMGDGHQVCERVYFGNASFATSSLRVSIDEPLDNFSHFIVYTLSALVEQTTPAVHLIFDASATVASVELIDKDLDSLELGGTISWTWLHEDRVDTYVVYLASNGEGLRRSFIGELLVGTDNTPLHAETALGEFTHTVVYTRSSLAEQTTPGSTKLVDIASRTSGLTFPDFDMDALDLGGVFSWEAPDDTSQVTHYLVYFASLMSGTNASCTTKDPKNDTSLEVDLRRLSDTDVDVTNLSREELVDVTADIESSFVICNRDLFKQVPVSQLEVVVLEDTPQLDYSHLLVYTRSSLVEQTTPSTHFIDNKISSVSRISFTDKDMDADELGGSLQWKTPAYIDRIEAYNVFAAVSAVGMGRSQIGDRIEIHNPAVAVKAETKKGSLNYFVVYTVSSLQEQTTPVPYEFADLNSTVTNITFPDFDLDSTDLGGTVRWEEPDEISQVTHYILYVASMVAGSNCPMLAHLRPNGYSNLNDNSSEVDYANATFVSLNSTAVDVHGGYVWCNRTYIGNASRGISHFVVSPDFDVATNSYTHVLIYTLTSLVEQTTPATDSIMDMVASVSGITYAAKDLDPNDLGGIVSWESPQYVERVRGYMVYFAEDSVGARRSHIGNGELPRGINEIMVKEDTTQTPHSHVVVYTRSSLVEQTTPVSLFILDEVSQVSNISFIDDDLDVGEIGGELYWNAPDDFSEVTRYLVYMATDVNGSERLELANVSVGTNHYSVPPDIALNAFSHLVVYARSSLGEQTTPQAFVIVDTASTVSGVSFVDKDCDSTQLGGVVTWRTPVSAERVEAYRVYLADGAPGQGRSQIGQEVKAGKNSIFMHPETAFQNSLVVYTRSSLAEQTTPDFFTVHDTFFRAAQMTFPDYDLDETDLGGDLAWTAPGDTSQVTHYMIYFATLVWGTNSTLQCTPANDSEQILEYEWLGGTFVFEVDGASRTVAMEASRSMLMQLLGVDSIDIEVTQPRSTSSRRLVSTSAFEVNFAVFVLVTQRAMMQEAFDHAFDSGAVVVLLKGYLATFGWQVGAYGSSLQVVSYEKLASRIGPLPEAFETDDYQSILLNSSATTRYGETPTWGMLNGSENASATVRLLGIQDEAFSELNDSVWLGQNGLVDANIQSNSSDPTLSPQLPPWRRPSSVPFVVCTREYYANTSVGITDLVIPTETPLRNFTHLLIYALSSLVEQTTPEIHLIFDAIASVSQIRFIDKDLDDTQLGGLISWTAPSSSSRVEAYPIYFSTSTTGAHRSQVEQEVIVGRNDLALPVDTKLLSYEHIVIYTRSSLTEQTSPVSFALVDTISNVSNVTFPDYDLDKTDLGGTWAWMPPDDVVQVTHYVVYFATLAARTNSSRNCFDRPSEKLAYNQSRVHGSFRVEGSGLTNAQVHDASKALMLNYLSVDPVALDVSVEQVDHYWLVIYNTLTTDPTRLSLAVRMVFERGSAAVVAALRAELLSLGWDATLHSPTLSVTSWSEPHSSPYIGDEIFPSSDTQDTSRRYENRTHIDEVAVVPVGAASTNFLICQREYFGNTSVGTNEIIVPFDFGLGEWTHMLVYTMSSLVEQTTPRTHHIYDMVASVSDIFYLGADLDLTHLGGTITWSAPEIIDRVQTYVVYIAENVAGIHRSQVGTELPVGSTETKLVEDTNRSSFTDFVVYTKSSLVEQTTPVSLPILDEVSRVWNVTFLDFDLDAREIGGRLRWNSPVDNSEVTHYMIYLSEDARGRGRYLLGNTSVHVTEFDVLPDIALANFKRLAVYSRSSLSEQTTPTTFLITDTVASVSGIAFIDMDLDERELGGTISWRAPADLVRMERYHVYLSESQEGYGRSQVGGSIPNGTLDVFVDANQPLADYTHIVVYTRSALLEQTTPVFLRFNDTFSRSPKISFDDFDLDLTDLGGVLEWNSPDDTSLATHYIVYFATLAGRGGLDSCDTNATSFKNPGIAAAAAGAAELSNSSFDICTRTYYENTSVAVTRITIPVETPLLDYTHFLVYTESSLVEQTTPQTHLIFDAKASVSYITYTDRDLDLGDLGGTIAWTSPESIARVEAYRVYMATSVIGGGRSQMEQEVPVGTNELFSPTETRLMSYTQWVVYTRSSLVEQSTPVFLAISDTISTVSNITFPDFDLDKTDLGGLVSWMPQDDVEFVTHYIVYFSTFARDSSSCGVDGAGGGGAHVPSVRGEGNGVAHPAFLVCSREFFGNTSVGVDDITVPTETALRNFDHILIYTKSSLVEQTTPATHLIFDAVASVSSILFTDKDLDIADLGGLMTWTAPQVSERVEAYRVYLAVDVKGALRSQIEQEVAAGINERFVPTDTTLPPYRHYVVYTRSSLVEQTTPVTLPISDTIAKVSDITFPDHDLDESDIGGLLAWSAPADQTHVTHYVIYFATLAEGPDAVDWCRNFSYVSPPVIIVTLHGAFVVAADGADESLVRVASVEALAVTLGVSGDALVVTVVEKPRRLGSLRADVAAPRRLSTMTWLVEYSVSVSSSRVAGVRAQVVAIKTDDSDFTLAFRSSLTNNGWNIDVHAASLAIVSFWTLRDQPLLLGASQAANLSNTSLPEIDNVSEVVAEPVSNNSSNGSVDVDVVPRAMVVRRLEGVDVMADTDDVQLRSENEGNATNGSVILNAPALMLMNNATNNTSVASMDLPIDFEVCSRTYFGNTSVGVEQLVVPVEFPLLKFTHVLVYTLSSLVEQTTPDVHLIFDAIASVSKITFVDKDMDPGDLGGLLTWNFVSDPVSFGRTEAYRVYMAESPRGAQRSQIEQEVLVDTLELADPSETPLLEYTQWVIYTRSSLVEQTTPVWLNISDTISVVPEIHFPDFDLDETDLGGTLFWSPPADTAQVTHYIIYFSESSDGAQRVYYGNTTVDIHNITVPVETPLKAYTDFVVYTLSSLIEQTTPSAHLIFDASSSVSDIRFVGKDLDRYDLGGQVTWQPPPYFERVDVYRVYIAENDVGVGRSQVESPVALGTNVFAIPPETPTAAHVHIVVYTQSWLVEQTTPVANAFNDTASRVSNISFVDYDLDLDDVGGDIYWVPPEDYVHVTHYMVYLAENYTGTNRSYLGNVSVGTDTIFVPVDTTLYHKYEYFVVYTRSALVEQTTPAFHEIDDIDGRVHDIVFVDQDLDLTELGGTIYWTEPKIPVAVTAYRVNLAEDIAGTRRSQVGNDLAFGSSDIFVFVDTPILANTHVTIYTESYLGEMTTPATLLIDDTWEKVQYMLFEDTDLDGGEIGGTLVWGPALDMKDVVVKYMVYIADHESGTNRKQFAEMPYGINILTFPDLAITTETNMLVYTASALEEQTTPSSLNFYDVAASASNVDMRDRDLDPGEVGGMITWSQPLFMLPVVRYHVYFALSAAGADRSRLSLNVPAGTNSLVVPESTSRISPVLTTVLTCTFTIDEGVESVYYNGEDITDRVVGELDKWISVKTVSFVQVEGATLVVKARCEERSVDASVTCGFQMSCSNGMTSGSVGWEAHGSTEPIVEPYISGGGNDWNDVVESVTSAFLLTDAKVKKLWAAKYRNAIFRYTFGPPTAGTNRSYSHVVVYTASAVQGEQTTPASFEVSDAVADVSFVTFADSDLDRDELGGQLLWTPPSELDQVSNFVVYLAEDATGKGRSLIGMASSLQDSFVVPAGTDLLNFTHITVYARSTLGEQTTPAAQSLWNEFEAPCGSIPGMQCNYEPGEGLGGCTVANGCADCGLTASRIASIEEAIKKKAVSLLGAKSEPSMHLAQEFLYNCGVRDFALTFYSVQPTTSEYDPSNAADAMQCRYSCLPDFSQCRLCRPPVDDQSAAEPDGDGLTLWKYLSCKYRGIDNAEEEDFKYSYVFANGNFLSTGDSVSTTMSCQALTMKTVEVGLFDFTQMSCTAPGGACSLSVAR
eukprot:TRINITY_DN16876_c0_g4_i1.p1 TRINITY_DN16876_c0_g4~~TRINITY_DN16876_c0_g4_i1.p1  ORF type:complete len:6319 (+),score=1016.24 TRINITY_DN16876_c0_g4_i1:2009-18958(+)